jgi:hypothetical protein
MPTRRDLLKTTAVGAASCILSKILFAKQPGSNFHFIHTNTLNSWPLTDPVQWSIDHAHDPILARAAEGLGKLTECDGDRIIRLVVRRCSLNLLEVQRNQVDVQFWGQQGLADLKPFFKLHGLAHPQIEVVLKDRKKETVTTLTGDSLLYGIPIASDFDLELFQSKCERRFEQEADDWQAAPGTASGFAWDGVEDGLIPWAALKSAWLSGSGVCLNCSGETLLVNFGLRQVGTFNRSGFVEHCCGACRRSFRDETVDVKSWMTVNLDAEVWPGFEMVWGKRVKLEAKS